MPPFEGEHFEQARTGMDKQSPHLISTKIPT